MTAAIRELKINEVYWVNTSHEKDRDYVYQGLRGEAHVFMRDGAVRDTVRIVFIKPEYLCIDGRRVLIVDDNYRVDGILKDENPEEYERLQSLLRRSRVK